MQRTRSHRCKKRWDHSPQLHVPPIILPVREERATSRVLGPNLTALIPRCAPLAICALLAAHPYFTVSELGEVPASTPDIRPMGIGPLFLTLVPLLAFPLNYQYDGWRVWSDVARRA
jgi:hypothetical protein